jgi:hypothetical protein
MGYVVNTYAIFKLLLNRDNFALYETKEWKIQF